MARMPQNFYVTMRGMASSMLMAVFTAITDSLVGWMGNVPIVGGWLRDAINGAAQAIADGIIPGAPGAGDWLITIAETPGRAIEYTRVALEAHHTALHWIADTLIPVNVNNIYNVVNQWVQNVYNYIAWAVFPAINDVQAYANSLAVALNGWVAWLQWDISFYYNASISYTQNVRLELINYDNYLYNAAITYTYNMALDIRAAMITIRDNLQSQIDSNYRTLQFELAAAVTFITTVFVPGAIAAFKAEQTIEIAAGMDELWPLVFAASDAAALRLAPRHPLVAARAVAIPPEPVPGIGGAVEALTAAMAFQASALESVTVPLSAHLQTFGEDLSESEGILSTIILGAFTVAAIEDPSAVATATQDALQLVLEAPLTAVAEALGIAER